MSELDEVRAEFPEYKDWSDLELGEAIKDKYFADMPEQEFWSNVGVNPNQQLEQPEQVQSGGGLQGMIDSFVNSPTNVGLKYAAEQGGLGIAQAVAGGASELADLVPFLKTKGRYGERWLENIEKQRAGNAKQFHESMSHSPYLTGAGQLPVEIIKAIPEFAASEALAAKVAAPVVGKIGKELIASPKTRAVATKSVDILKNILGAAGGGGAHAALQVTPEGQSKTRQAMEGAGDAALFAGGLEGIGLGASALGAGYNKFIKPNLGQGAELRQLEEAIAVNKRGQLRASERAPVLEQEAQGLLREYTEVPKDSAKLELANANKQHNAKTREVYEHLNNDFRQNYGRKPSENLITKGDIPEGKYSPEIQKLLDKMVGVETPGATTINPATGAKTTHTKATPGKQTVDDAVALYRQARDEARLLRKDAKSQNLTSREKTAAVRKAERLEKVRDIAESNIYNNLDETGAQAFDKMQKYYATKRAPYLHKQFLSKTLSNTPEINTSEFLPQYGKKGLHELKQEVINEDYLRDALLRHDLSGKTINNMSQLDNVMRQDVANLLPEHLQTRGRKLLDQWTTDQAFLTDVGHELKRLGLNKKEIEARGNILTKLLKKGAEHTAISYAMKWILGA